MVKSSKVIHFSNQYSKVPGSYMFLTTFIFEQTRGEQQKSWTASFLQHRRQLHDECWCRSWPSWGLFVALNYLHFHLTKNLWDTAPSYNITFVCDSPCCMFLASVMKRFLAFAPVLVQWAFSPGCTAPEFARCCGSSAPVFGTGPAKELEWGLHSKSFLIEQNDLII